MGVMSSGKHGVSRGAGVKTSGGKSTAKAGHGSTFGSFGESWRLGAPGVQLEGVGSSQRGPGGRCQDWGVYSEWEPGNELGARLEELSLPLC